MPVLAKLVIKDTTSASRLWLARRMAQMIAQALPARKIHVTGDAAYAGSELKKLPPRFRPSRPDRGCRITRELYLSRHRPDSIKDRYVMSCMRNARTGY